MRNRIGGPLLDPSGAVLPLSGAVEADGPVFVAGQSSAPASG